MPILTYQSGPSGGNGGDQAQDSPTVALIPADAAVTGITVWSDSLIEQIIIGYQSESKGAGTVTLGSSTKGTQNTPVQLQAGEYITSIQGTFGGTMQTMQLLTNMNQYGPWGTDFGNRNYRFDIPGNCRFVGVFGFTGTKIDSFGVYFVGPSAS